MNRFLTLFICLYIALNAAGQAPTIKYTGSLSICAGKSLVLTIDGAAPTAIFKWRKDAVLITPAETGIAYTATTTGTYDVIVTTAGVHDTLPSVKVTVNPNPVSNFTSSPGNQCSNLPLSFNNISTGTGLTYSWTFGDPNSGTANNTSDDTNPKHTFIGTPGNANQSFTVVLTSTDNKGCKDNASSVVTVKQVPGTQLGGTGATTYNGLPYFTQCNSVASSFTFTNQSSTKLSNTGYQVKWGDVSADFIVTDFAATTHTYNVGTYKLQFIVTGGNGCKDTATYNVFVGSNPAVGLGNPGNTIICSGTSLTFPISSTASNPPGTVYTVTFNDGTAPIIYNHPAPASVTHRFDEGSCGITSGSFSNSFSATIVASNPCGVSAASVVPIYVSKKAEADFSISPKDTTCINSLVTLTNTGINANSVSSLGVCSPGKSVWTITPATGWTVSSGNRGDDFGLNDPSVWSAGSTTLGIVFTTPGIYKVKLKTGGTLLCGDDEIEKTICVNPTPVAAFTVNQTTGCLPLAVTTVNNSTTPNCGVNTYNWTVSYSNAGGCDPGVADYDYIGGTNANSANPQFRFNNPGVYTLRLVTTSKSSNCVSAAVTKEITVKAKPSVSFSIPVNICQNSTINPVASINNCYSTTPATYSWTFTGGIPASSTSATPGNITYNTAGPHTISLTVTNECGPTTATKQITVKPTPDVTVPANQLFCTGEATGALTFSSASGGATFSWTNSNTAIGLAASGTGNITSFTATNPGAASIVATITIIPSLNGCPGPSKSFTITVNPKPGVPTVTSPVTYCQGEIATALTATTTTGNTLLWYTTSTGGTGSSTAPTPNTASAGTATYYVSQINTASGCESSRTVITVTINTAPKITSSSSVSPTICASSNGSIILNGLAANTSYTIKYNKNSAPVTVTLTSNANGVLTITGLSAGTYSNVLVILNGCPSNEFGPFTLTDPNPPATPTAGSNSPLCIGGTLNLTSNTTSAGNIIYSWSGPNGFTSNQQNVSIADIKTAANGDYTVTVNLNGCSASKTVSIVVNPKPSKPSVDRPVFYCLNAAATALTGTASAGNTLTWYDNKNLTNGVATAPVPSSVVAGTVFYYVTQTNSLGCISDTSVIPVTIYPLISGNTIGTNQTLCAGNIAAALTTVIAPAGGNGIYQYQWQVFDGTTWTDIVNANTESYSPGTIASTTKYRRIARSGLCAAKISNEVSITIQGTLNNYDITASQSICEGQQPLQLIGQLPAGGSGTFSYEWESSPDKINWTKIAGAAAQNYQPTALNASTHYRRKVTSGSCAAYSSVVTINVNRKPVMNPVADVSYCYGSSGGNISFGSVPSPGVVYSWVNNNPSIGLAASGNGNIPAFTATNDLIVGGLRQPITARITVTPAFDDGIIHCAGDPTEFIITVLPFITPFQVSDIPVCSGITIPFHIPPSAARDYAGSSVNYHWNVNGNSIDLTNGSGTVIPAYTTINNGSVDAVSVITLLPTYTLNGVSCVGGPMSYPIIVKPGVTDNSISADQNICVNTSAAILKGSTPAGGDGGYKYQWQSSTDGGSSWNDMGGASEIDYDPGLLIQTTKFRRSVNTSLCTAPAISNVVTINVGADANALFTSLKDTGCAPFVLDASVINLQRFPQNQFYNWYANNVLIGSDTDFAGYTINKTNDSVTIKLVTVSGCKADSIEHKFYTYLVPVPSFTLSDTVGCGPLAVTINNTTPDAALFNYHWDLGNGNTSTAVQPGTIVFAPNPLSGDTTYYIKLKVVSVCDTITIIKQVRVKSKPKALFAPNSTVGCSPMTVVFNNTSPGIGNSYSWDFGDGTILNTNTSESVSHIFTTAIRDTFYVKLKATNECGIDSLSYAIVVSPNTIKLDFAVNGNEETGCSPHAVKFINNSKGASNFTWNFGDGNIINTQKNIDTVTHVFQSSGTYMVTLQATNGCSDTTSTETITVYPTPRAAFEIHAACLADTVRFTNLSESATSYQWQFGDGTTSIEKNPNHKYQNPGTYTVVLKAFKFNTPGSVCTDSISRQVLIGPSGTLSYTSEFLCNNRSAVFQVQTTNADTLIFNFGDGKKEVTINNTVFHLYANAGTYLPSVTLKNKAGCEIVLPGIDSIKADKIKAGFHVVKQQLCGSTTVSFSDTSHAFFGIASRHWNLGDGTTATGKNVSHTYTTGGTYTVELIVVGNSGCSDTIRQSVSVVVNNIPVAAIQADAISCVGYTIPFSSTVQSAGAINILQWSISNGVTNNNSSFTNAFSQAGDYTVKLIAGTVSGCYDTVIHNIHINPSPTVRASNDVNICLGNDTRLNATSINPVSWSPIQGLSCVTCPNPIAAPLITTPYVVQATNNFGCAGYDTVVVTVIQPLQLNISPDDSICIGQSTNLLASGATSYSWSPAIGLNNTSISNPTANPVVTTRYRVVGYDGYNCFTDTAFILVAVGQYPTITLGPDLTLSTGTLQPLASAVQNGPVSKWIWTPSTELSCSDCPLPIATIKKNISYTVDITNNYGCSARDTINIKVFCENSQVFIANAFTPDNDGINDILMVQGKGIVMVKSLRIFNRWGEVVFERSSFAPNDPSQGWDGKIKGVAGGPDVFVFTAEVICENGTPFSYKGNVSIIK